MTSINNHPASHLPSGLSLTSAAVGLVWITWAAVAIADESLAPWRSSHHSTDVAKRHVQKISSALAEFVVVQGGTMDGENTRSPQGVWQPFEQTWESNRSVRVENIGESDVANPWLARDRGSFRSTQEIVAAAVKPGMSDHEKALALWWQQIQYRFHQPGDNDEVMDPVKLLNVYGHNTCGNDSIALAGLWKKAGFKVAPARVVGHCVTQVFYDGGWHLMDGDMHSIYLLRDNETVAGEQDLVRDHDLVRRTHTQGILQADRRSGDEWESSIYVYEGDVNGDRNAPLDTTMNMTLRPNESITWRWGHLNPVKQHGSQNNQNPDRVCNGLWEYRPDFARDLWRQGAVSVDGIVRGENQTLVAEPEKTGVIIWAIRSPYVFVGGKLEAEGNAKFSLSWDGKSWTELGIDLDKHFRPDGPARYQYYLRCQLSGDARLKRLSITNDLQMAPLTLPGMSVGKNSFTYTDQSKDRNVLITHEWVERSASQPPLPPPAPIFPLTDGKTEGTAIAFEWKPPSDPDGDKIVDYHFELSSRADMLWPLSMSFTKLISRTADTGKARYTLPSPGLLNPDRSYYWHVRAKDAQGIWGPWSETWRFTPSGPAPPVQASLEFDAVRRLGTLRWKPSPLGSKPVAYRVYASDEKGFSVSDNPYPVTVGISKDLPSEFPANFVAQTEAQELVVIGIGPFANKAFYRVVAVDAAGNRSGPSDYATAPRPIVTRLPSGKARVGAEYRSTISAIHSLGDLRTRVVNGKETMSFWDIERLKFALVKGPSWLKIEGATGVLSGTPDVAGNMEVELLVTLEQNTRKLDEALLKWGQEKVLSSSTDKVGSVTERFQLEVGR
jgi:hypothetical protein